MKIKSAARRCAVLVLAAAWLAAAGAREPQGQPAHTPFTDVDPFIGTGGDGHTFPGAVVPFGMVQLSPDTAIRPRTEAYGWAAGYRYEDTAIVGFSHTHFSGTGHSDLGDVLVMPVAGAVRSSRGDPQEPGSGYRSRFSPRGRDRAAGLLRGDPERLRRSVPSSPRARAIGLHRYAFPAGKAGACAARPAHQHLRLPGQGAVVAAARARRWHRDRLPRDARLGAGQRSCTSRCVSRAPMTGREFRTTEQSDVAYKGFPAPGRTRPRQRRADRGPRAGRRVRLRHAEAAVE